LILLKNGPFTGFYQCRDFSEIGGAIIVSDADVCDVLEPFEPGARERAA
jgi:hypothetical protein